VENLVYSRYLIATCVLIALPIRRPDVKAD
jgi:hypothetical protein